MKINFLVMIFLFIFVNLQVYAETTKQKLARHERDIQDLQKKLLKENTNTDLTSETISVFDMRLRDIEKKFNKQLSDMEILLNDKILLNNNRLSDIEKELKTINSVYENLTFETMINNRTVYPRHFSRNTDYPILDFWYNYNNFTLYNFIQYCKES